MEKELEKKVMDTIKKYDLINKEDRIVVGVSGGTDSMSLLNCLIKLKEEKLLIYANLVVAHINHQIREEANEEEEFVKNFCGKNKIEFYSKRIDVLKVANNSKIGLEEAGRNIRYDFFEEICKKTNSNKIAIAHNKNDKVETVIMNFLRGTGISGLKGIEAKRGKYIRPLIECTRDEIENYCRECNLNPKIDKSNFDNKYTRNKIRNLFIPYVQKEYNPNIIETVSRLADIISEEEEERNNYVKKIYNNILEEEGKKQIVLDLKGFNSQEKVIKSRLIRYTITKLFGSAKGIEKIHIEDIIKLCSNNIGNKYLTPNKNIKILVKNSKIYFSVL